jgi:hypothetical protein
MLAEVHVEPPSFEISRLAEVPEGNRPNMPATLTWDTLPLTAEDALWTTADVDVGVRASHSIPLPTNWNLYMYVEPQYDVE